MGRRSTGTVEPLKTSIRLKFTWRGARCVETLQLSPTPANIKAAERIMAKIQAAIDHGVYDPAAYFARPGALSQAVTFREVSQSWLNSFTGARSTKRSYKAAVSFWNQHVGETEITAVRHSALKEAIAGKMATTSGKTLNNYLIALRGVFDFAIADLIVDEARNPTAKLTNLAYQTPAPQPFDLDEVTLILAHMRERYPEQVANYFEFAFSTGMRTSELIGLKWGRVDWRRNQVTVDTAKVLSEEKGTKTNRVRDVDLTDRALAALTRQKAHTFLKGSDAAIFENPITGRAWADEQQQWRLFWVPTLKALGMRMREAYQTRHTYATLALMAGVNPAYIARQMGHANTGMLFKHYGRWIDGADKGAEAAKLNGAFVHVVSTEKPSRLNQKD